MPSFVAEASFIAFEGSVLPETDGWTRVGTQDADRWIDDSWFVQSMDLGDHGPPPFGESDRYQMQLAAWAGVEGFFIEFRVESDGPASELPYSAPASVSMPGGEFWYKINVARDRVRFHIDLSVPAVEFAVTPDVRHVYRLDLRGSDLYEFSIDGQIVAQGTPTAPAPEDDSVLSWGGRYYEHHNTNRWDYLRFGEIPEPASGALLLAGGSLLLGRRRRGVGNSLGR